MKKFFVFLILFIFSNSILHSDLWTNKGSGIYQSINGSLVISFTTIPNPARTGHWQVIVIAPDQTITKSQSINIQDPQENITFTVPTPILLGRYALIIYDIDIAGGSPGNLITNNLTVTNTYNNTIAKYTPTNSPYPSYGSGSGSGWYQIFYYQPFINLD
jgi:hypothetical protein